MTAVGRRGPMRSGLGSSLDVPMALLVATALLVLGLQGPTGSSIALPLTMASLTLLIAVRRPRGCAWTWALAGSMAWTVEELAWSWTRTTGAALPAVGAVTLSDVLYLAGSVAWLVALLRLSHVRWPLWTLSALPPLVVLGFVLGRVPGAGPALSFPLLDGLLILASLPALEGTLRGRASDARLLWLELRQDERGPWPAVVVVVGLVSVIFVTATSLFDAGMGATARVVTLATLGYVQLVGVLAVLVGDRVRQDDVVLGWGDEEFRIVAAGLDAPLGAALLARLRQALRLATPTPLSRPLTFSAGLVVGDVPSEAATVFEPIERADTALYAVKRAGLDRVEIASATRAERGEAPA